MPTAPTSEDRFASLRKSLGRELFQTEQSAASHCRREAARLGDTPPARALLSVAEHADRVLAELPQLAAAHGMTMSSGGRRVGRMFSVTRELVADRLLRRERSFRGTLLGIRHGLDLVRTLRHLADATGDEALFAWCESWLTSRVVLAQHVEEELRWFAGRPDLSMETARPLRRRERAASEATEFEREVESETQTAQEKQATPPH